MPSAFATEGANNSSTECNYLGSYLSVYRNNDIDQMLKLQTFLKEQEGFDVKLSGVFDSPTIVAVREFQTRYSEDILEPWNLKNPTGNVSITTRHKINDLSCGIITPLSNVEKEIIQSYSVSSIEIETDIETTDTVDIDMVGANTYDITKTDVLKDVFKEKSSESKTNVISPIVTIESLPEYLAAADAEIKSDELSSSTTSSGALNNLSKNDMVAGIPVEFNSQFSLPILIMLATLLLIQLYFFGKTSIDRKMRWVTKRF